MLNIRRATAGDAINIAASAIATWVDTYAPIGMNTIYSEYILGRFTADNIAALIESSSVTVAETGFGLVGYSLVSESDDGSWQIETLYVLPRWHGAGVGKLLLDAIVADHAGPLWLKCADDNLRALSFYRKHGFIETGEAWFELAGARYRNLRLELSSHIADRQGDSDAVARG